MSSKTYEIADFNPATAHLFECNKDRASEFDCSADCTNILYAALMRVDLLCSRWDLISKGETSTTHQIRQAIEGSADEF